MTMNKIIGTLRRKNKGQYRLLGLCVFLSILLVTSFSIMYFSPTMQRLLPEGGDTRKLAVLMFAVTIIGCTIFTVYGSNLFYKYKSREFGIFLALGETKEMLTRNLVWELIAVIGKYTVLALVVSVPVSFLIWKLFQAIVIDSGQLTYQISIGGIAPGILFALLLTICIFTLGARFVRRANIMDIINDQRKTEMVREVKPWTGKAGAVMVIVGLLLAMGVPSISARVFLVSMPTVWNATYLISVVGLYLVMLSAVGHTKKGKDPQKYYKNIVSTNLMRFTARQTTRNMCVITLLVFVMMIAAFWGVQYVNTVFSMGDRAPADCTLHYPSDEQQVVKSDIYGLAEKHGVEITSYEEMEALELIIDYQGRDLSEDGKYIDINTEKYASFLSVSDFARISGQEVTLRQGEYMTVVGAGYSPQIWVGPDCLRSIETSDGQRAMTPKFKGTVEYDNLSTVSEPFTFILSDQDYQEYLTLLTLAETEQMILFNVKDVESTYAFAAELREEFILRSSEKMHYGRYYDVREAEIAKQEGKDYGYGEKMTIDSADSEAMTYWKYTPFFKVLTKAEALQQTAVFVLLSVYIAIISLAAIGVMSYVRSITIAIDNKQLFFDLQRLGANKDYVKCVIRVQLRKVFTYPAAAGSVIVMIFALFMTCFNDMNLEAGEVKMLGMLAGLIVLMAAYMYGMYKISFRKMKRIVEI